MCTLNAGVVPPVCQAIITQIPSGELDVCSLPWNIIWFFLVIHFLLWDLLSPPEVLTHDAVLPCMRMLQSGIFYLCWHLVYMSCLSQPFLSSASALLTELSLYHISVHSMFLAWEWEGEKTMTLCLCGQLIVMDGCCTPEKTWIRWNSQNMYASLQQDKSTNTVCTLTLPKRFMSSWLRSGTLYLLYWK